MALKGKKAKIKEEEPHKVILKLTFEGVPLGTKRLPIELLFQTNYCR